MSRVKNGTDLLLRVRQDKMSRGKNDADMFAYSKTRQDEKSRVRNDADL